MVTKAAATGGNDVQRRGMRSGTPGVRSRRDDFRRFHKISGSRNDSGQPMRLLSVGNPDRLAAPVTTRTSHECSRAQGCGPRSCRRHHDRLRARPDSHAAAGAGSASGAGAARPGTWRPRAPRRRARAPTATRSTPARRRRRTSSSAARRSTRPTAPAATRPTCAAPSTARTRTCCGRASRCAIRRASSSPRGSPSTRRPSR